MNNVRIQKDLQKTLAVTLSLSFAVSLSSCSEIKDILVSEMLAQTEEDDDRHSTEERETSYVSEVTYETFEPTGTFTTETYETMDVDAEYLQSVYIYTQWYDIIDDNPIDYAKVSSDNAYAIKNVFYFNTQLYVVFEARLYMGDELILTKNIEVKNSVVAEAEFSAGLEGFGTFSPGMYTVELVYEDEVIAVSRPLEVA